MYIAPVFQEREARAIWEDKFRLCGQRERVSRRCELLKNKNQKINVLMNI